MSSALAGVGAAAAPATGGLSMLLPLLMSFGPGLLSHLFGGKSPEEKLRAQMMNLLAPGHQNALTNQFYQQNVASPAFAQGQRQIGAGVNSMGNDLASRMGLSGIGQSGSGALLSSLMPSIAGGQMAGLQSGAWNSAQGQAQQTLQQQLAALQGTNGPSQSSQLFGAGMSNFSPFLEMYMKNKFPGSFGGAKP